MFFKEEHATTLTIEDVHGLHLLKLDLQLFAAEDEGRTEDPTEKKIRDARDKGQVARTEEFPQAFVVIAGFLTLFFLGQMIWEEISKLTAFYLSNFGRMHVTNHTILQDGIRSLQTLAVILIPLFVVVVVAAVLSNVFQVGFQVSTHPLQLDFSKIKISPQEMMKKIFISKRVLFNLAKSIFKVIMIAISSYLIISSDFDIILNTPDVSMAGAVSDIMFIAFKIVIWGSVLLIALSIPDYFFQKSEFIESVKMTKQETKEEMKEQMGDPYIKARLKELQRELLSRNMIKQVPKADVIVTNPTHFAVALKWEQGKMDAPAVVAKGVDNTALRIREIAKENDVTIIENRPLAQEMYRRLEIGDIIPEDLLLAVVEVYRVLYQQGKLKVAG